MPAGHRLQINHRARIPRPPSRVAMVRSSPATWWLALALALVTSAVSARQARSQGAAATMTITSLPSLQPRMVVPFDTGEKLTYDVRFGGIKVGTGRMEV